MGSKPIKVFYSPWSGRFYASSAYKMTADGLFTITGSKFDVTDDIGHAIDRHEITFSKERKDNE